MGGWGGAGGSGADEFMGLELTEANVEQVGCGGWVGWHGGGWAGGCVAWGWLGGGGVVWDG